jgi:hypothetical protein
MLQCRGGARQGILHPSHLYYFENFMDSIIVYLNSKLMIDVIITDQVI